VEPGEASAFLRFVEIVHLLEHQHAELVDQGGPGLFGLRIRLNFAISHWRIVCATM